MPNCKGLEVLKVRKVKNKKVSDIDLDLEEVEYCFQGLSLSENDKLIRNRGLGVGVGDLNGFYTYCIHCFIPCWFLLNRKKKMHA